MPDKNDSAKLGYRLERVETALASLNGRLRLLGIGSAVQILASINTGAGLPRGSFPPAPKSGQYGDTSRTDQIEEEGRRVGQKVCKVKVAVTLTYTFKGSRTEVDTKTNTVVRVCNTYKIDISVVVTEECDPASESHPPRTSTFSTEQEFCNDSTDGVSTGEGTAFDGTKTDTLTYKNGTKVKVEKKGQKVTVTVVYPDGTTATTTVE